MRKYEIINMLGQKFNFNSYLEISSISTGFTYDKVDENIFTIKSAIHYIPDEPDEIIKGIPYRKDINIKPNKYEYHHHKVSNNNAKYDIVFIDSWHTYTQTLRDIMTALELVSSEGIIVIHDCCPYTEDLIGSYRKGEWCGQTYEAFINFRYANKDLEVFCLNTDYGCGIISRTHRFSVPTSYQEYDMEKIKEWNYFNTYKTALVNLIEPDEFIKYFNKI